MNFVFYDTETTGINTSFDQILQFAAIKTDGDFNEIERFEIRCRLLPHVVPAPRALLTTGVTPEMLSDLSLPTHYQAMRQIAQRLESWSPAVFVGYNTMQFDERLLRQSFYQNLLPVYMTNTNQNRRADILKLVDAAIVFAPNSVAVPLNEKGRATRKLDMVAPANGFEHDNAHDALADVEATIHVARLIRTRQPKLWDALLDTSAKQTAVHLAQAHAALALVESRYGRQSVLPVTWCGQNPEYDAQVAMFDLRHDPADYSNLSLDDLISAMRAPKSPFRIVQANSNPILHPLSDTTPINDCPAPSVLTTRIQAIQGDQQFQIKVGDAVAKRYPEKAPSQFVEERIYDAFPASSDMRIAAQFHATPWESRRALVDQIRDERLRELAIRLIGTEASHTLNHGERANFDAWQRSRLLGPAPKKTFRTIEQARRECADELATATEPEAKRLCDIMAWLETKASGEPLARCARS